MKFLLTFHTVQGNPCPKKYTSDDVYNIITPPFAHREAFRLVFVCLICAHSHLTLIFLFCGIDKFFHFMLKTSYELFGLVIESLLSVHQLTDLFFECYRESLELNICEIYSAVLSPA